MRPVNYGPIGKLTKKERGEGLYAWNPNAPTLARELQLLSKTVAEIAADPFSHWPVRCGAHCNCDSRPSKDWTKPEPHSIKHNVRG